MEIHTAKIVGVLGLVVGLQANALSTEVEIRVIGGNVQAPDTVPLISAAEEGLPGSEVDFGEEGDVILRVSLRDIPLTDGMYALMQNGRLYLPLGELSSLVDFPIVVDPVQGVATGWYLKPTNTFSLNIRKNIVTTEGQQLTVEENEYLPDDLDIFVDSMAIQRWLPLVFDVSLLSQTLVIRSSEKLPKELARERGKRKGGKEVTFAANNPYDIPAYRLLDWPEVSMSLGSFYSSASDVGGYDYRVRAVGDMAFMSGRLGFSGRQDEITGATLTLGRNNPGGMMGPLRIADFEVGDTSQFLPSLIGSSLSGRGVRFGNARLTNRRDLDTIDIQGEQQAGFEVELYVNDRLQSIDRDSSDINYNFQDVPLSFGQNELRLEFYGPQGQRYTEIRRSFVGSDTGQRGRFTYEMALLEPSKKVFDIIDDVQQLSASDSNDDNKQPLRLSSALNVSYGLTRNVNMAVTLASVNVGEESDSENRNYLNAKLTSDVRGVLLSGEIAVDSAGKLGMAANARTELRGHELSFSQRITQSDYKTTGQLGNSNNSEDRTKLDTRASLTKRFFPIPGGRLSYAVTGGYAETFGNDKKLSLNTRLDYQIRVAGMSWQNNLFRNIALGSSNNSGLISVTSRPSAQTGWTIGSSVSYNDGADNFFNQGSLRMSRSSARNGSLSFSANRDLANESNNYSAAWQQSFQRFHFNTSISGSSSDDISLRLGLELAAKRYPGRWLPMLSNSGGRASIAVLVFADDNGNGEHDAGEGVLEGVRLTRNGLPTGVSTDGNGIALLNGLSANSSVDLGLVESDIGQPDLKYTGIDKGILPRQGRIPVVEVALKRATDIEGTVTVTGGTPVPNVRLILTPVDGGEPMEIRTEFDGYYYLAHIPLGTYDFGPDPEQLETAGMVAQPPTRRVVLRNLEDFPPPEDFNLIRLADLDPDDDDDGVPDVADAFPLDPEESVDTDDDGIGNNADTDDDADGVTDTEDAFPLDANETIDTDGDGMGDNADTDDDGDGTPDHRDAFPFDAAERYDTDGDGIGNNKDRDDDGDKVNDRQDAFPLDPGESDDADLDGIGDNADTDDDNDTVADTDDFCPGTNIPELTVPSEKLSGGRYAMLESTEHFSTTNQRSVSMDQTAGCSCEQILVANDQTTKNFLAIAGATLKQTINNRTPKLGAALQQLESNEISYGCKNSTLRKWSRRVVEK